VRIATRLTILVFDSGMKPLSSFCRGVPKRLYLQQVLGETLTAGLSAVKVVPANKSLRVTSAMEAGIADHAWSLEESAATVKDDVPAKRGHCKLGTS